MATEQSGEDKAARLRVGIIAGSTRPGRQSRTVAEWVCADPIPSLDLRLIDLADSGLPLLCEPAPAAFGQYQQPATRSWSQLGMATVGPQVAISLRADYAGGRLEPRSFQPEARKRMLDQLARWATALRALRLRTTSPEGQSRPALDDPSARAAATSAVERLVAGLQDGVDRACADVYDRQFASDILWGSPYGATLSGYEALNAAHHSLMAAGAAPPSRYQVVQLMSPLPGVAIAHVRRNDLIDDKDKRFSEMAMYVLVERGGQWWLAAGQNTPVAERPA